jgi:outer membrane protein insertion porin family
MGLRSSSPPGACGRYGAFAQQDERFVVRDMRVEGLQRISEGTVFNYLPVSIGDQLDADAGGGGDPRGVRHRLFSDVELRRDGDTLVIAVRERPSIRAISPSPATRTSRPRTWRNPCATSACARPDLRSPVLEDVQQFLIDQYYSRGKYSVVVDTEVTDNEAENTVDISDQHQGRASARASARSPSSATRCSATRSSLSEFELRTRNWLSWYRQDDRYSRETLIGDLETLQSFYMDRGYANFEVESTQVQISPDRQGIYITINVAEGEPYRIGGRAAGGQPDGAGGAAQRLSSWRSRATPFRAAS